MSITLNDNIKVNAPKPSDERYLNNITTHASISAANAYTIGRRHIGLTVNINNLEYWYALGITDSDLVAKIPILDFSTIVAGLGYTPENIANKVDVISGNSSTEYPTENAVVNYVTNNVSPIIRNQFVWTSGAQNFTLSQNYSQVYSVETQGGGALHTDQYTLTSPNILTILDPLDSGDYIVVLFTTASSGSLPYYTQAQVDSLLANKMDKIRTTKIVSATTYTLLSSDSDKILYFTSSSPVTLTVPSGLTLGNCYEIFQQGAGQISIVGSGTTLRCSSTQLLKTLERYSLVGIDSITNVTEEYKVYAELVEI